jgi:hypothetical protein
MAGAGHSNIRSSEFTGHTGLPSGLAVLDSNGLKCVPWLGTRVASQESRRVSCSCALQSRTLDTLVRASQRSGCARCSVRSRTIRGLLERGVRHPFSGYEAVNGP